MKAAPFEYLRPTSLSEACAALSKNEAARVIAGGQTLVPMMAMRLARPSLLVDIARLDELIGIRETGDMLAIGACTRQAAALASVEVKRCIPLLSRALPFVGHEPTRNRGTVGGSIANADPSAEIPLVAVTLGASFDVVTADGEETFEAESFFFGPMLTAIPEGGCIATIRFPIWPGGKVGTGFHEICARKSDFAFASAAAQVQLDEEGRCARAVLGIGGATDFPERRDVSGLVGIVPDRALVREVAAAAVEGLETVGDLHASEAYRERVARELANRALIDAIDEARGEVLPGRPQ